MRTTADLELISKRDGSSLASEDGAQTLVTDIRQQITNGKLRPGDRILPLRDLASQYHISFLTARSAISRLEQLKWVYRKNRSGTFVSDHPGMGAEISVSTETRSNNARSLRSVGLMINQLAHVFGRCASDVITGLNANSMETLTAAVETPEKVDSIAHVIETWRNNPPRAVVVQWQSPEGLDKALHQALAGKTRLIAAMRSAPQDLSGWHCVKQDNVMAMRLAAKYFLAQGHRRIGLMLHARVIDPSRPSSLRKRTAGHITMIRALGLSLREQGIRDGLSIFYDRSNQHGVYDPTNTQDISQVVKWLSQPNRPRAIVGQDSRIVLVIQAAKQMGLRIPDDLQLLGIGNTPWASAFGFLSIRLREDLIAREIVNLIRLDSDPATEPARQIIIPPELPGFTPTSRI